MGVLVFAAALSLLAYTLGLFPPGIADLYARAIPAVLVLLGLGVLLHGRVPLAAVVALVITSVLVGAIVSLAYTQRAEQVRTDTQQPIAQALDGVTLLRVEVNTLTTDVEIVRTLSDAGTGGTGTSGTGTGGPAIGGLFTGSSEHRVEVAYTPSADSTASLVLTETGPAGFPSLENIGRGALRLEIPAGVPVDIAVNAGAGSVILNLSDLSLERVNATVESGDLVVTLPDYQPRASGTGDAEHGTLTARDGDLVVFVPGSVAARFTLDRGGSGIEPQYEAATYNYLVGDVLEARAIEAADAVVRLTLVAPRGLIRVGAA
jgi:hypothetical protein